MPDTNTLSEQLPYWFQLAQPFALAVFAGLGVVIAFRQWRTQHDQLRLDLYEKRWAVYEDTKTFCKNVMRDFKPAPEDFDLMWNTR